MKIQKPTDIDAHLKYKCPKCCADHWLSLQETKTRGFKVVCYCGTVFGPKKIKKIKIIYSAIKKIKTETLPADSLNKSNQEQTVQNHPRIDNKLLDKCTNVLVGYGFTKQEAKQVLEQAYIDSPTDNLSLLVKSALKLIGAHK